MILLSNWPALPTNGSPALSSSAPGASPTNIKSAEALPTPNTTFLREDTRLGHCVQANTISRKASNESARAPTLDGAGAGWEAAFEGFVWYGFCGRRFEASGCVSAASLAGSSTTCRCPRAFCWCR